MVCNHSHLVNVNFTKNELIEHLSWPLFRLEQVINPEFGQLCFSGQSAAAV